MIQSSRLNRQSLINGYFKWRNRMDNNDLYGAAIEAIDKLFEDKSVSQEVAMINLRALIDEIHVMLESLDV